MDEPGCPRVCHGFIMLVLVLTGCQMRCALQWIIHLPSYLPVLREICRYPGSTVRLVCSLSPDVTEGVSSFCSVDLQVAFGKDDTVSISHIYSTERHETKLGVQFWTNLFPTELLAKHSNEIKRFKWVIRFMRWFEVLFAVIPIKISLKMFFFSDE